MQSAYHAIFDKEECAQQSVLVPRKSPKRWDYIERPLPGSIPQIFAVVLEVLLTKGDVVYIIDQSKRVANDRAGRSQKK